MKRLNQETFVCIDCEMTGLDLVEDRIIEIAVIKFTFDQILEEYETLIDPQRNIPKESIAIHHITEEMVQGKPTIDQVIPQILSMAGSHILIGHGIKHDVGLIALAAKRANIPSTLENNLRMDTLRLARSYGESPINNSLAQLGRHFNVAPEGAHRAMSDVIVNMQVFKHLCRRFRNVDEVFELLSKPILMKTMPFGPHKGRIFKEIPLEYLLWAARKDFDEDLMFTLRSEIKRRKKGNLFSQASNPFKDL